MNFDKPALLVLVTLVTLVTLATAFPALGQDAYPRQYETHFLELPRASMVIENECPTDPEVACEVRHAGPGLFRVTTIAPVHEAIAAALAAADVPPETQAFSLILLKADRTGRGTPGDLPAAARGAIDDVSDFLPYTHYTVLDSAIVRSVDELSATVAGPGDTTYEARLGFQRDDRGGLFIEHFQLLRIDFFAPLVARPPVDGAAAVAPQPRRDSVLGTSFSMEVGETVVVGTSKLDGGEEALVVLLTAIPD